MAAPGDFAVGLVDGNCLEAWVPVGSVESAHDLGNRPVFEGASVRNVSSTLEPAPEA